MGRGSVGKKIEGSDGMDWDYVCSTCAEEKESVAYFDIDLCGMHDGDIYAYIYGGGGVGGG